MSFFFNFNSTMTVSKKLLQRLKFLMHTNRDTQFCVCGQQGDLVCTASNKGGSLVWNLLHETLLVPRILKLLLGI